MNAAKRSTDAAAANGTAKRMRNKSAGEPGIVVMATVVCEQCGAQFAIGHRSVLQDPLLASRQAIWLADKLFSDLLQRGGERGAMEWRPSQNGGLGEAEPQLEDCRVSGNASATSEPVNGKREPKKPGMASGVPNANTQPS